MKLNKVKAGLAAAAITLVATTSMAGEKENAVMAACVAKYGVTKAAAVCAGAGVTVAEIEKFFKGEAFGENNDLRKGIEKLGKVLGF